MPHPFEITNEDIERLNDRELTDLLRRLLHLEAATATLPASSIGVSLKINVSDGGEDGRIQWEGGPERTDWLPGRLTMFQCKATDMPPAECRKEVLIKEQDRIKPQVEEVLDVGGSYILFHNRSLNVSQKSSRVKKIREAISCVGKDYSNKADIQIYDANMIANWVNRYIPAIVAVSRAVGHPLPTGLLTWEGWNKYDKHKLEFVSDKTLDDHIAMLRNHFVVPGRVARIVGLSGLGKTRLALEAFRPLQDADCKQQTLNEQVVYLNAATSQENIPSILIEWRNQKISGVLVVDDCDPELHRRLCREIEHADNLMSLLTLDYNPDRQQPGQLFIKLRPAPFELIKRMLVQAYPDFREQDIDRIANFAEGFPQMAALFAEARLNAASDIGSLDNEDLLIKLLWGREEPNVEAYKVISACAVFRHVGFKEDKSQQRDYMADRISRTDRADFYEHARWFIDRDVLEERGRFISVKPQPLAIRLAAEWWKRCSPERAMEIFVEDKPVGMSEAMSDQLAKLNFLPEAKELVRKLCSEGEYFSRQEVLDSQKGSRLFRPIVEINPEAAAGVLLRVFDGGQRDDLLEVGEGRFNLTLALEKLCFWRETFPRAARLLLAFAAGQDERGPGIGIVNAAQHFLQLFHVYLPGTQAPLSARLSLIRDELSSPLLQHQSLAVRALGEALKAHSFSRGVGVEMQGTRMPMDDWRPTDSEIYNYWRGCLELLTPIARGMDELAALARQQIARNIMGLISFRRIGDLNQAIRGVVEARAQFAWPEAVKELRLALRLFTNQLTEEEQKALQNLLELLQPQTLAERLRDVVSLPAYDDLGGSEKEYTDEYGAPVSRSVVAAAKELGTQPGAWVEILPSLLSGEQQQGYEFGYQLGKFLDKPREFIDDCFAALLHLPTPDPNMMVLRGFLSAVQAREPELVTQALNNFSTHEKLRMYTPALTLGIKPAVEDIERLLKLADDKHISVLSLRHLANAQRMAGFTSKQVINFCDRMLAHRIEGVWAALHVLNMYTFRDSEKWEECRSKAREIMLAPGTLADPRSASLLPITGWGAIAERLLKDEREDPTPDTTLATHIASEAVVLCAAIASPYEVGHYLLPILRILLVDYRDVTWPVFGEALLNSNVKNGSVLERLLGAEHGEFGYQSTGTDDFFNNSKEYLLAWAKKHSESGPVVLARIVPFTHSIEGELFTFGTFIKALIDRYGNREDVQIILEDKIRRFSWYGESAPHYLQRIEVMEPLQEHPSPDVALWAGRIVKELKEELERARTRDAESGILYSHF